MSASVGRHPRFDYGSTVRRQAANHADTLFNLAPLRKVFEVTLLRRASETRTQPRRSGRQIRPELQQGGDIAASTLGQLATPHVRGYCAAGPSALAGLGYTAAQSSARSCVADGFEPGKQNVYTHAGYILLALASNARYAAPIDALIEQRTPDPSRCLPPRCAARRESAGAPFSGAKKPRGAGLWGDVRRSASGRSTGLLSLARNEPDVFLGTRHGALPRRQSWRAAGPPRCKGDALLRTKPACHRVRNDAGAGVGDRRRGPTPDRRERRGLTTPRTSSA